MTKVKNEQIIKELLKTKISTPAALAAAKRKLARKYKTGIFLNSEILAAGRRLAKTGLINNWPLWLGLLRKRAVRTLSGVAPVAVLTKPYPCPGKCVYCPKIKNVPTSYLPNEPAVMRALRCEFNPYRQAQERLRALEANGHEPNKIELIVIGGTWSVLPKEYKYWYISECFRAANDYGSGRNKIRKSKINELGIKLAREQKKNEKAKYRIIGLTLETRPDYIDKKEIKEMRELGATRVELGVQAIDDRILKLNQRGHGVKEIARATALLKNYGFKVTYHLMPGLPGSKPAKDLAMFKKIFSDERFQPDQIKFYPTIVTRGSRLYQWWQKGNYRPYGKKALENLIISCKKAVPPYTRIIRLIRDIPGESIAAGNLITNLRQALKDKGAECRCIRCREARGRITGVGKSVLRVIEYQASGGREFFLSYESRDKKILYGFCRLRLPGPEREENLAADNFLKESALIRELHVYGELVPAESGRKKIQHAGLGKKLMRAAEELAIKKGFKKIAVIAGIGAREYYKKLGYRLEDSYLVKEIQKI